MASQATLDRLLAEFDSPPDQLTAAVALLEQGASPAYVARYCRWSCGNLGEERLHGIADRLHALLELEPRKQAILQQADDRGRRTPELEATLASSVDQDLIDDIYQSMRPRRRGVAMQMEEKGLLPLVMALQHRQLGEQSLQDIAATYVAADQGLPTPEAVLEGAVLVLADRIAHDWVTRARFRDELRRGILRARPVNPDDGNAARYRDFFEFAEPIGRIPAGRMLALRRAEREGVLRLELTLPDGRHRELLRELHGKDLAVGTPLADLYDIVYDQAAQALQDICGKDVRRRLKEKADRESVRTYARNLRSQLLSPPLGHKKVLSLRTSSKVIWAVLLGEDGSVQQHKTLPTDNEEQKLGALTWLVELIKTEQPAAIAVPHGRRQAGSERVTQELRQALGETPLPMVVAVDEAASTIFATSTDGKKAIPGVEVGVRTAISLGRRLQDPLLELARMDVRTLGIGQTLDDVHQGMLQRELGGVTSACLALVGGDLNTIDQVLLEQLPGLDADRARSMLEHRRKVGGFTSREALREVPGLDAVTFRNIAGFLCVHGGSEPLDASAMHPDDYALVRAVAEKKGCAPADLLGHSQRDVRADDLTNEQWSHGHVVSVLQQLHAAKDDPRGVLVATTNEGVHSLTDLHADRELKGRVANLTEFGAFIDLGIGQDGLVHISQIPGNRLRDPEHMLCVGEVVTVWVLGIDQEKHKISLTMHKPRHLAEGRLPTLGERLEQQQGRRRPRPARGGDDHARVPGRAGSGAGPRRPPGEGNQEGGERRRFGGRGGPRGPGDGDAGRGGRDRDRDDRFGDRGPRGRGPREQRVYTVEPAREVAETRTHKGEVTSLASLRALLSGNKPAAPETNKPPEGGASS
ncbi:MAG: helix-hairpin-helix domain-containing protein [Planctomycetes bacterium]|nr:helix-hairpin-helix domain-containing protein [Planctomycetota bacterium]